MAQIPADTVGLTRQHEQLVRAIQNPNLAASKTGSPENVEALERIQQLRDQITALQNPANQPNPQSK